MRPRPEQVRDIAVAVRIKTIGGACQDLGKRPRGGIKISSKCTRPPLGGLGHETRELSAYSLAFDCAIGCNGSAREYADSSQTIFRAFVKTAPGSGLGTRLPF